MHASVPHTGQVFSRAAEPSLLLPFSLITKKITYSFILAAGCHTKNSAIDRKTVFHDSAGEGTAVSSPLLAAARTSMTEVP